MVIASSPENILLIIFGLYACSGPFTTIRSVKKLKLEHVLGDDQDADFMRDSETKAPENSDANEKSTNNDPK